MGNILVPVQVKEGRIHSGHEALIAHANTMGDAVVMVSAALQETTRYLQNKGKRIDKREDLPVPFLNSLMMAGARRVEVPILSNQSESIRGAIYRKSDSFMSLFDDYAILPRYKMSLRTRFATTFMQKSNVSTKYGDHILRGPEVVSFIWKKVDPLLGRGDTIIYSTTHRHSSGIKEQTTLSRIDSEYYSCLPKMHSIYLEIRPMLKIGSHDKMVEELNSSYPNEPWRVIDITVWEGKFVDGRLEVIGFTLPYRDPNGPEDQFGGSIIVEDGDYIC